MDKGPKADFNAGRYRFTRSIGRRRIEEKMKRFVLIVVLASISGTVHADDGALWKALAVPAIQLPSTAQFQIAEQKTAGRLVCSHRKIIGQPETFDCALRSELRPTYETALAETLASKAYGQYVNEFAKGYVFESASLQSWSEGSFGNVAEYRITFTNPEVDVNCSTIASRNLDASAESVSFSPLVCKHP
jgi:hypothetical protein